MESGVRSELPSEGMLKDSKQNKKLGAERPPDRRRACAKTTVEGSGPSRLGQRRKSTGNKAEQEDKTNKGLAGSPAIAQRGIKNH